MVKSQKGFLLIDVLIGMLILTIALVSLAYAYTQSVRTSMGSRNYNQAVYLAQKTLEGLKTQDGSNAFSLPASIAPITSNGVQYTISLSENGGSMSEPLDANVIPVQVTVKWSEPSSTVQRSVSIENYYYYKKQ
ncbi:Hypothetical protein LUCI_4463 [Lucifera butyrica]|uniref:Type iv pilin n-term methylation site gfxxxe n=1 Tax=Lucifera butyrica TaxID=1351585 RepID=A0A498RE20_9FIRM|nr:hypothetical protein [Lucifera butyrica]VBB09177.1 Hypothetical protein LUCI_4463 [Lucifera butyrica]